MLDTPFSPWPSFSIEEAEAISNVLISNKVNYWTGPHGRNFEAEFAAWSGARYAVAVCNGTFALEASLRADDIGPGDEVIVSARSFIASAACVISVGAKPVFADVEIFSGNVSASTIEPLITPRTRAVVCVHLAGWPCDLDPIMALSSKHGFFVVEDCAQAHGAIYKGKSVGSIGHIAAWSFCQDKIVTTGGEGGMITCNDETLWKKLWSYKDHGKAVESLTGGHKSTTQFRWSHNTIGTNGRMTEIQAAIGRIQLKKLEGWTEVRNHNARLIFDALREYSGINGPIYTPSLEYEGCTECNCKNPPDRPVSNQTRGGLAGASHPDSTPVIANIWTGCRHAYYKLYLYLRPCNIRPEWTRNRIIQELNLRGVPCYTGSCPEIYLEDAFRRYDCQPKERLKGAMCLGETSMMFLVHPTLKASEIGKTAFELVSLLNEIT
jgi:dTDP-4-amino-4,6-dideoxygalactose transaminase